MVEIGIGKSCFVVKTETPRSRYIPLVPTCTGEEESGELHLDATMITDFTKFSNQEMV